MRIDRKQMKLDAKAAIRGRKPSVYLVTLVYLVILYVLQALSVKLQFPGLSAQDVMYAYYNDPDMLVNSMMANSSFIGSLLNLAITIMTSMLAFGFASFCLNVARGLEAGYATLFDAFGNFLKFLWLDILIGLFTMLWSLLFVIPGIIAAYRYSMAIYILLDDPDKSAMECIRESKEMTRGHKGELFVLDLSFIGWILLSAIPFVSVYTEPYMETTKANYYRALSGRRDAPEHIDIIIEP